MDIFRKFYRKFKGNYRKFDESSSPCNSYGSYSYLTKSLEKDILTKRSSQDSEDDTRSQKTDSYSSSFQIYSAVTKDGSGIEITKELCKSHAAEVLKDVQELPDGDAKNAIIRIVNYLLNK